MKPELAPLPPRLWRAFSVFYWSLIIISAAIILFLLMLLTLLTVAFLVAWVASLMS